MIKDKPNIIQESPEFTALKIALIYFFISFLWVLFSDNLLVLLAPSMPAYVTFSSYKGIFFVLATTIIIFYLIKRTARKVLSNQKEYYIEQFKIEEKLNLSNEILERVNSIVLVADSKGSIIYASPFVKDILGYSTKELLGRGWWEKIWNDKEQIKLEIKKISDIASGKDKVNTKPYERNVKTKDGKTKWFLWQDAKGPKDYVVGIAHDITELKKAEELHRESEEKYKLLFGHSPVGIFVYNLNLTITNCNDKFSSILNVPKYVLVGLDMNTLNDKNILPCIKNALTGEEGSYEGLYKATNSNNVIWIQMLTAPLKDSDGRVNSGIAIVNDISEKKKTEDSLKASEERYRAFISQSIEGIYRMEMKEPVDISLPVDKQVKAMFRTGVIEECNEAMAKMYGYESKEELINKTYVDFYGNFDDPVNLKIMKKFIENGYKIVNDETIEYDKNRKTKYISNNAFGIIEYGKLLRLWGTQTDVTELREKQELIRKLSHAVEQSPNAIAITNSKRIIEYINNKFTLITGYKYEEVIGKDLSEISPHVLFKDKFESLWKKIDQGNIWSGEISAVRKNGEKYYESITVSPIKDKKGYNSHFLIIMEDISLRKAAEEELYIAKEKAEEMSRLKSNFLANMSHELRTPLTGILGFSEMLYTELKEKDFKDMAEIVLKGSRRLNHTLNSILDLSKIESDKVDLRKKHVNLTGVILEIGKLFMISAKEKKIDLKTVFDEPDVYVVVDEYILTQVISNLVNNAIKFTKEGQIIIETGLLKTDEGEKAYIKISDTGIGIAEKSKALIFEPFRQVSEGLSRTYEGTGLGLTITKKFVEIMGGTIELESEFGRGTTFTISFPAAEKEFYEKDKTLKKVIPQTKTEVIKVDIVKKMYKVLVIEDDEINKKMVRIFLQNKFITEEASDEESALKLASSKQFDIILLDINLKGKDGIETLKKIRLIPGYKNIPVSALTAYSMVGDKERFLNLGCDYYISKPYTKDQLLVLLNIIVKKLEK